MILTNTWNINPESLLNMPGNVWVYWKDKNSLYLGCNEPMAEALNCSDPDDIIGKTDYELSQLCLISAELFRKQDHYVMSRNISKYSCERVVVQNSVLHFSTIKMPLLKSNKKLVGIVGLSWLLNSSEAHQNGNDINNNFMLPNNGFDDTSNQYIHLTNREIDCANLVLIGMKVKEIALKLNLSPRTIETHINNLKLKLNCRDKIELTIKLKELIFSRSDLF